MSGLIGYIVLFPFLGFLILTFFGRSLGNKVSAVIGIGSVGLSALLTIWIGISLIGADQPVLTLTLWKWFDVAGLNPDFGFRLDSMSLVFVFVITFVGFLIHLYSS